MNKPLRVLLVEDSPDDATLLLHELRRGSYTPHLRRVETGDEMTAALHDEEWDVIITDFTMPRFSGTEALALVQRRGLDIPVIFVSGTMGEERAVAAMKSGAKDYLVKGNLRLLVPAIEREVSETAARRAAAQKLSAREEQLQSLAANLPGVIFRRVMSADGRITYPYVSDGHFKLFGYAGGEISADPSRFLNAIAPESRDAFRDALEVSARDLTPMDLELRIVTTGGERRWVRTVSQPRRLPSGETVWDGISLDITKEKSLDEQSRTLEAQLRQAQKLEAVGTLTGGMAHDFNNLLQVVIGNVEVLCDELADRKDLAELATAISEAGRRGADLIRRLLAFARQQTLEPTRFNMGDQVRGMVRLLERTLGEHIEIALHVAPDVWPAFADAAQVEAALVNLAVNARDAMPDGGRLTITVKNVVLDHDYAQTHADATLGDYVVLEVSDTGTGMSPEVQARVFEPFFTTKEVGKGTGLGLSMVYGFARQSGGHVSLYSEEGKGTTVQLYVPRARDVAAQSAGIAEAASAALMRGKERILIVDDKIELRRTAALLLQGLGYEVIEADGPQQALELLAGDTQVDLLFTDVVMPGGMSGLVLAKEALILRPRLRVLFTSGFPNAVRDAALPTQGQLLAKPYRRAELAHKIREILDS